MTAQDMYNMVKNIMSEKNTSKVFEPYFLDALNIVLAELFEENNMCRYFNDKKPLTEIPYIKTYDVELTYEPEYLREVIPWGVAAQLETDDDLTKNGLFGTKYSNARDLHLKIVSEDVIDAIDQRADI